MRIPGLTIGLMVLAASTPLFAAERYIFPDDPSVLDVKKHCGAIGDGIVDDTAALQKALDDSCGPKCVRTKIISIPNGTYRITKTLVMQKGSTSGSGLGAWIYGESREGVIIKLDDHSKDVKSLLLTHPTDEGATSANWFYRNIRNLTLDVGNNPTTDGIRYMANNQALIQNVTIQGNGNIGINAGFIGESGPNSVQDISINGFDIGIKSHWCYGQTLSRVTISKCRSLGVHVIANVVALEDLIVRDTPQAVFVDYPNDWTWWSGVVAIVGGKFTTTRSDLPAIRVKGHLFARDINSTGYSKLIAGEDKIPSVAGSEVAEYSSHGAIKAFENSSGKVLRLPSKREPIVPWETDASKWLCVNDYGVEPNDDKDDTAAIQKAFDTAGKLGKTVVSFRSIGGHDPSWYILKGEVKVPASVRMVIGLGFARILGGQFVVDDNSADTVKFLHLYSLGGPPMTFENRSQSKTMIVESLEGITVGNGGGDIFITDCPTHVRLNKKGQNLWARALNPEGTSESGLVQNHGGNLWVLGCKTEGKGKRYLTTAGGKTELYGCYEYTTEQVADDDKRAMFEVIDGSLSVAATREVCFHGKPYSLKLVDTRGNETKRITKANGHGTIAILSADTAAKP
jgi:Pectate lyase superfamily protein